MTPLTAKHAIGPAIILLGPGGYDTAQHILAVLPEAAVHAYAPRCRGSLDTHDGAGAVVWFEETAAHLRTLFAEKTPLVLIGAAGIAVRALAPLLEAKRVEPAVVAVAEDGASVVPLLGGHHGANDLARRIAQATGGHAAITTAGDVRLGVALDAPPPGWRLADPARAKPAMAALLAGARLEITNDADAEDGWLDPARAFAAQAAGSGIVRIRITCGVGADDADLVYHPALLVLGVGCARLAPPAEVEALALQALNAAGLSPRALAAVASIELKAAEPAIHALAEKFAVPARFFSAATLEAERPRLLNPSTTVFTETGCHGVAEGAALAGAGAAAVLAVPKRKSANATVAIARADRVIDAATLGRARGRLMLVGIGPGSVEARTHAAGAAIGAATDLVGYKLYLDLLGPLAKGKRLHGYDLGAEEARVRLALEIAAEGREVALICSGDAGIYAMASLVYELIDRERRAEWLRLEITGVPGVSAMQTAAARAGAPLGHDFCAISLSDLLTPWETIAARLAAAAAGDFVIAFYNPVSARRRGQLMAARDILLKARPGTTPVVLARNLGRSGESVRFTDLDALRAEDADMLTLVIVGSSQSRLVERPDGGYWMYTPRGYAAKLREETAP